ncbi:MAG: sensor histidine kinase [Pseudonocardiaceae bacterium]
MVLGPEPRAGDRPPDPPGEACRHQEKGQCQERDQWVCRRLLERQLHDGAALRISALTLRLGLFQHDGPPEQAALQAFIAELQDELHAVLEELRDVAGQLYPPLLGEAGLGPALREVADRMGRPVVILESGERFGLAAEGAAYFAVAQCLASLPAGAPAAEVILRRETDELMLSVSRPGASTITARIPCE